MKKHSVHGFNLLSLGGVTKELVDGTVSLLWQLIRISKNLITLTSAEIKECIISISQQLICNFEIKIKMPGILGCSLVPSPCHHWGAPQQATMAALQVEGPECFTGAGL